jgi:hypothetical protein
MPIDEARRAYNARAKQKVKTLTIQYTQTEYSKIEAIAEAAGEAIRAYCREAIRQRMEQDAQAGGGQTRTQTDAPERDQRREDELTPEEVAELREALEMEQKGQA